MDAPIALAEVDGCADTWAEGCAALGRLRFVDGGAVIDGANDLEGAPAGDLVLAADALGWGAPRLCAAALVGGDVFEDDVILALRPNETISVSAGGVAILGRTGAQRCCEESDEAPALQHELIRPAD